MEQHKQITKLTLDKTLNCLPNYTDYWIFTTSPLYWDVHQTLPLPHKTLRYSSSSFIYVTNIHFIDFGMTSLEFGP